MRRGIYSVAQKAVYSVTQTTTTSHLIRDLAKRYLECLEQKVQDRPREVLESWVRVANPAWVSMTRAVKFEAGVLHVSVRHSTLLSLLHGTSEKAQLLVALRQLVPDAQILDIVFRIG